MGALGDWGMALAVASPSMWVAKLLAWLYLIKEAALLVVSGLAMLALTRYIWGE